MHLANILIANRDQSAHLTLEPSSYAVLFEKEGFDEIKEGTSKVNNTGYCNVPQPVVPLPLSYYTRLVCSTH